MFSTKRKREGKKATTAKTKNGSDGPAIPAPAPKRPKVESVRRVKYVTPHNTGGYSPEERAHWLELAAKQGMSEKKWERAVNRYGVEVVERSLAREPWEVCEMCWHDWFNVRYLLRQQAGPFARFRNSAVPGPLHRMIEHRCLPPKEYDPKTGKYPTFRSWRKAWRGQASFPPFVHLAQYCIDVRRKWVQRVGNKMEPTTEAWVTKRLKFLGHARRQCTELHSAVPLSCKKRFRCCQCGSCGDDLRGKPYHPCCCGFKDKAYYCASCYAAHDVQHMVGCRRTNLNMARQQVTYPPPQPRACDPLPLDLLMRLPAELCYEIAQWVRWAHWDDLPEPMRTPKDRLRA